MNNQAYQLAQSAIADLKSAVYIALETAKQNGLTNAELGRSLGIYAGHVGHEGHISRTLLSLMESEGIVVQSEDKKWYLKKYEATS